MNRGIHLRMAAALSNDWGPLLNCYRRGAHSVKIVRSTYQIRARRVQDTKPTERGFEHPS